MTCEHVSIGELHAIACHGRKRARKCKCGRAATKLCDWPMTPWGDGKKETCDAPLCEKCAHVVGPDMDYCEPHHQASIPGATP